MVRVILQQSLAVMSAIAMHESCDGILEKAARKAKLCRGPESVSDFEKGHKLEQEQVNKTGTKWALYLYAACFVSRPLTQ